MPTGYADGAEVYREAFCRGLRLTLIFGSTSGQMSTCESRVVPVPQSQASIAPRVRRMPANLCAACHPLTRVSVW